MKTRTYNYCIYGLLLFTCYTITPISSREIRWCTVSQPEQRKCQRLSQTIATIPTLSSLYSLVCSLGQDAFDCMQRIQSDQIDLLTVDAGTAYYGSNSYSLRPIGVENYASSNDPTSRDLFYYANVVVPANQANRRISPRDLRNKEICSAGTGTAEGWIMPLGALIADLRVLPVTQCNSVAQNLIRFFGDSCFPNVLTEAFNPFGDNTQELCQLCFNKGLQSWCTSRDRYAGSQGALRCLREHNEDFESKRRPSAAFVRAKEIELAEGFPVADYQLLCPTQNANGSWIAPLTSWATCQWGRIPSRLVVTSLTQPDVSFFTTFLTNLVTNFGPTGLHRAQFDLFNSTGYQQQADDPPTHNLLFSDFTRNLYIPPDSETVTLYRWFTPDFMQAVGKLSQCPLPTLIWCVIDPYELGKCQRMSSAFTAKRIQPKMLCVQADSTLDCMRLIQQGYADMMTVEAGDLYAGGKYFNLVPIVAENYGVGSFYYTVAIVEKVNPGLLISNWRHKRTCHSGVGKATGWIVPINYVLDTQQIRVLDGMLINSFAELISRACLPGILNQPYDETGINMFNLCELCTGGNQDMCADDHRELFYGDSGAFRCLTEGADIAFGRHTTVYANTAGRNPDYWARNLREDNYQLICPDGRRSEIDQWETCNLGRIQSNVVVTGSYKSENERTNMWRMLQYGQEYYSEDKNPIFRMFQSGFNRKDLIFSDDTESLALIPWENQTYEKWLGPRFLKLIANLDLIGNRFENGIYSKGIRNSLYNRLLLYLVWLVSTLKFITNILSNTNLL